MPALLNAASPSPSQQEGPTDLHATPNQDPAPATAGTSGEAQNTPNRSNSPGGSTGADADAAPGAPIKLQLSDFSQGTGLAGDPEAVPSSTPSAALLRAERAALTEVKTQLRAEREEVQALEQTVKDLHARLTAKRARVEELEEVRSWNAVNMCSVMLHRGLLLMHVCFVHSFKC